MLLPSRWEASLFPVPARRRSSYIGIWASMVQSVVLTHAGKKQRTATLPNCWDRLPFLRTVDCRVRCLFSSVLKTLDLVVEIQVENLVKQCPLPPPCRPFPPSTPTWNLVLNVRSRSHSQIQGSGRWPL